MKLPEPSNCACTGLLRCVVLLSPSFPKLPAPHVQIVPSERTPPLCRAPVPTLGVALP